MRGGFPTLRRHVPESRAAPVASGTPSVGQTLSVTNGVWYGDPPLFTYQWQRNGVDIPGATANTYTTTAVDLGSVVRANVTATDDEGSATASSNGMLIGP